MTTDDIQRVANLYFTEENSAVAVYYRRDTGVTDNHPALNGLDEEERQQARETMAAIAQLDVEQLQQFLIQATQMVAEVPVENKDLAEAVLVIIQERLDALGDGR